MNKGLSTIDGLGKIKCGAYEKISVEGIGLANDAITAKKIYVHGIFKGKKVRCTDLMNVEGIMGGDIQFGERTKFSAILGNAILEKQESSKTCEIGTLICKKKTYCSPDCTIMNECEL